jgi:hypothetical protein
MTPTLTLDAQTKKCNGCGLELPLDMFSKHRKNKDGLQGHCKNCNKKSAKKWNSSNKDSLALKTIKERAAKKGILFDLCVEDIKSPEFCPILGMPLCRSSNGKPTKYSPSVDRIDPSKGYVKDNIQVISQLANAMKQNASKDELLNFAKWVIETYGD